MKYVLSEVNLKINYIKNHYKLLYRERRALSRGKGNFIVIIMMRYAKGLKEIFFKKYHNANISIIYYFYQKHNKFNFFPFKYLVDWTTSRCGISPLLYASLFFYCFSLCNKELQAKYDQTSFGLVKYLKYQNILQ